MDRATPSPRRRRRSRAAGDSVAPCRDRTRRFQVDYTYDINSGYITELQLCLPSVFTLENPDLEFFKTFEDLSLKDKGLLKQILGIPNNELYKTSLEYFKK